MTPAEMAALHAVCFASPRPWSEQEFADLLQDAQVFKLTDPYGLLLGRVVAGEAELLTLAVDPAQRGRGIGAKLVAHFLSEAAKRGSESAFLEVAEDNGPARRLYARLGFVLAGKRRGYYHRADGRSIDAFVLVCNITAPKPDHY